MPKLKYGIALILAAGLAGACARPNAEKPESRNQPKAEYQELKAEEYAVPAKLAETLPGLKNDKLRIWKEISPTINLVAYFPDYTLKNALERSAAAFLILVENPAFKNGIDFWIIQTQPEKGAEVLVWGVKPSEAEQYQKSGDLKTFFRDSEYVLVNDQILPKGDDRLKYLP